ncbi:MAG: hypothetical protein U5K56_02695 [Halioglobus sp.]|nr:hypothetical protein [Halioglobus sp.]
MSEPEIGDGRCMQVGWEGWSFPCVGVCTGDSGLLWTRLKAQWVLPMKALLQEQLARNR